MAFTRELNALHRRIKKNGGRKCTPTITHPAGINNSASWGPAAESHRATGTGRHKNNCLVEKGKNDEVRTGEVSGHDATWLKKSSSREGAMIAEGGRIPGDSKESSKEKRRPSPVRNQGTTVD